MTDCPLTGVFSSLEVKEWLHARTEVGRVATKGLASLMPSNSVINHLSHSSGKEDWVSDASLALLFFIEKKHVLFQGSSPEKSQKSSTAFLPAPFALDLEGSYILGFQGLSDASEISLDFSSVSS